MENQQSEVHRHFYMTCCELLQRPQHYIDRHYRLTRWNNRNPGNGHFDGYGYIRMFNPRLIQVCFRAPFSVNRTFTDQEEVFAFLRSLISH